MRFDYRREVRIDPIGWEFTKDVATASRGELLWYYFPGDVYLATADASVDTQFGWVPLLHFAVSMCTRAESIVLAESGSTDYAFTESNDQILFEWSNNTVHISFSFTEVSLASSPRALLLASQEFLARIFRELSAEYPRLLENPVTDTLRAQASHDPDHRQYSTEANT